MWGGCSFTWGGPEFLGEAKGGGPKFFPVGKGGDQNFFTYAKGGPEKIGNRPSQTDGPPPGKNDSSLTLFPIAESDDFS